MVLALMAIALLWFAGSWGKTLLGNLSVQTMIASSSNAQKSYDTLGFVCLEEALLHADMDGETVPIKVEGEKVAKNRAVYKVTGESGKDNYYYAPCSGIVSYEIDGYEQIKSSEEIAMLDFAEIKKGINAKKNDKKDIEATNDTQDTDQVEYRAKIINHMTDVIVYVILPKDEYLLDLEIGKSLKIEINDADVVKTYRGKVIEKTDFVITKDESFKECYVIGLNLGVVDGEMYLKRIADMRIVYDEKREMIIPNSALVYQNEEVGVYCLKKKFVVWQEVVVLKKTGESVRIEGLEEGTEIVVNPNRVTEGKYIR